MARIEPAGESSAPPASREPHSPVALDALLRSGVEVAERSAGNLRPVPWIEASDVAEAVRFVVGTEFVIGAGLLTR